MKTIPTVLLGCLWASLANGQTAARDAAANCPAMNETLSASLRWEAISAPDMLLCRAIVADNGDEAFAVTISRESPFKPIRANRAETGTMAGRELQWYRGELFAAPQQIVREALVAVDDGREAHFFMHSDNADTVAQRQRMVESLQFRSKAPDTQDPPTRKRPPQLPRFGAP